MFNDNHNTQGSDLEHAVNHIALHPTMHLAMVASQDGSVAFYDPRIATAVKIHTSHASPATAITCEPQGLTYATGCSAGDIRVWDLRTVSLLLVVVFFGASFFSPKNNTHQICFFFQSSCLQDMTKKHRASNGQSAVTGLAFHLTRGFLASGGSDSIIKIYQPKMK